LFAFYHYYLLGHVPLQERWTLIGAYRRFRNTRPLN
jgi:hypothetical protein